MLKQNPRLQSSCGQHGAYLGPVGPSWAPRWPHEPCYQGHLSTEAANGSTRKESLKYTDLQSKNYKQDGLPSHIPKTNIQQK